MEEIIFTSIYHGGILSERYVPTYVGNYVPTLRGEVEVVNLVGESVDVNLGEEGEVVDLDGDGEVGNLGGEGVDVNLGEEGVDDNLGGEGESDFLSSDSDLGDIPSEDGSNIDEELRAFRQERRNKKTEEKGY
ncbi:hypothetical protein KY290_020923 [Solanum tuberosum]|uniref:Uncharacterized protein n=1 Tax=Solanum tuberosum TaxID=4113 RepID=A0ABQ7V026_SOLTU|nr:hypothetical protein KY289_022806 [Solanum tuberosum]KAH0692042.1 hypothetical protein KY285_019139 [Solanum tuberosum]KAH0757430.1 hypothetical protein KY290_020923 [Solanum tuberosum]